MPEDVFQQTIVTKAGDLATVTAQSDRPISEMMKDGCFDLLYLASLDPTRTEVTMTIRLGLEDKPQPGSPRPHTERPGFLMALLG